MTIRKANMSDLGALTRLFDEARKTMATLGIDQWQNGYPFPSVIEEDVKENRSFCAVSSNGDLLATFALIADGEPDYDEISDGHWLSGDENKNYLAIHRVAVSVESRGSGISGEIIKYASDFALRLGKISLRIDTHEGNIVMRKMLEKDRFEHCGTVYLASGEKRVAYEKMLRGM